MGLYVAATGGTAVGAKKRILDISYWKTLNEVLFFGEISKIRDGKLYNQKAGATDFLTVGGVAGSYTFQAPDTAPYKTADTDYIWFKSDASQRTTTEAELIGYDFTRSIIKYEDVSDYSIQAIMILSSDLDTSKMRNDFHLSRWWDNTLSLYGNIKGNRAIGKNVWTPEVSGIDKANALIARMTAAGEEPTAGRKTLITNCVVSLDAAGLFDSKFDCLWIPRNAGVGSTKLNWIQDAHNLTKGGAGTLTQTDDLGYHSDNSSTYLNTNYNPKTQGVKFTLNDGSFLIKVSGVSAAGTDMHGGSQSTNYLNFRREYIASAMNGANGSIGKVYNNGYNCMSRTSSSSVDFYLEATKVNYPASNSTDKPNANMFLLALSNAGSPLYYCAETEYLEIAAFGASLNQTEYDAFKTIMNTYIAGL